MLDGIRGLAVLSVFAYHAALLCPPATESWVEAAYYRASGAGWTGVDLFFVLSGFLITGILMESRGGSSFFLNFYARRVLRIFPLYYGVLFVVFILLSPWHALLPSAGWYSEHQWWFWTYLQNWLAAIETSPRPDWLTHFWSLAIEEQFYLAWPLIVWRLSGRSLARLCTVLIVFSVGLRLSLRLIAPDESAAAYFTTPARLDGLLLGALLSLLHREIETRARCQTYALRTLLGAVVVVVFVSRLGGLRLLPTTTVDIFAFSLLYVALINVAVLRSGWGCIRVLTSWPLRKLGTISYGFYVFHYPVLLLVTPFFRELSGPPYEFPLVRQGALLLTAGAVTLLLAQASWSLFERHFLGLKRHFEPDAGYRSGVATREKLLAAERHQVS